MTIITEIALIGALWPTLARIQLTPPLKVLLTSGIVTTAITAICWGAQIIGMPPLLMAVVAVVGIFISAHLLGTLDRAVYGLLTQLRSRIQ
jgi:hypothetical protein